MNSNVTETKAVKPGMIGNKALSRTRRFAVLDKPAASSSSTATEGIINRIVNYFLPQLQYTGPQSSSCSYAGDRTIDILSAGNFSDAKPSGQVYTKYCYSLKDQPNHLICPQRESTLHVFSKQPSFDSENFGEDSFTRCVPMTWQNHPSVVACDGQQTSFIYVPTPSLRLFDLVDGWLLLLKVTPAVIQNLRHGIRFLKNVFTRSEPHPRIKNPEHHKRELLAELHTINRILRTHATSDVDWAKPILRELEEDVEDFLNKGNYIRSELDSLYDRLRFLREDIAEQFEVFEVNPILRDLGETMRRHFNIPHAVSTLELAKDMQFLLLENNVQMHTIGEGLANIAFSGST